MIRSVCNSIKQYTVVAVRKTNYIHKSKQKHQNFIFQHAHICIRDCLLPHNSADIPANRIFVRIFSTQSGYTFSSVHYQFVSAFCRLSFRPNIIWRSHNIEYDISFLCEILFSIFYTNIIKAQGILSGRPNSDENRCYRFTYDLQHILHTLYETWS